MLSSNYTNRLFGRKRGRSKKKINLKNYYETVKKYKFQNFNEETEYILDVGTGYGETSIFLAKKFPDKVTNVRPIAMMPTRAASRIIVLKLNKVRKFGAVTIP